MCCKGGAMMFCELQPTLTYHSSTHFQAVVFFSFWQSFALSILVKAGLIRDSDDGSSANSTAEGIQNFLICLEMVAASVAHR